MQTCNIVAYASSRSCAMLNAVLALPMDFREMDLCQHTDSGVWVCGSVCVF